MARIFVVVVALLAVHLEFLIVFLLIVVGVVVELVLRLYVAKLFRLLLKR